MKKLLFLVVVMFTIMGCNYQKVPAGNVGIKFDLYGSDKGVQAQEVGPGKYWLGINEEMFLFPTFTQNYVWTKDPTEGSPNDESITFDSKEGMQVGADVGITYNLDPSKISTIFQKYKKGIDEITDVFLRNMVRDAFVIEASKYEAVQLLEMKGELIESVTKTVQKQVQNIGINVEKIYYIGSLRPPQTVIDAIEAKVNANQIAEQRENEKREAIAQADKIREQAKGEADAILELATAQAKANKKLSDSVTPTLVQYQAIQKWDGKMPQVTGSGGIPMINLK